MNSFEYSYIGSEKFIERIRSEILLDCSYSLDDIKLNLVCGYYEKGFCKDYFSNELGYCFPNEFKIYIPVLINGFIRSDFINIQSLLVHELTHIFQYKSKIVQSKYYEDFDEYINDELEIECIQNEIKFRMLHQTIEEICSRKDYKMIYERFKNSL